MSVIAYTIVRPREGKRAVVEDRVQRFGAIYTRLGAEVKLSRIIAGPNTDCVRRAAQVPGLQNRRQDLCGAR